MIGELSTRLQQSQCRRYWPEEIDLSPPPAFALPRLEWTSLAADELDSKRLPVTEPLRDPAFFRRYFLELGALAWPNGFDLSASSLQKRLEESGRLHRSSAAA